jgi:hypothetical protein
MALGSGRLPSAILTRRGVAAIVERYGALDPSVRNFQGRTQRTA